MKNIALYIENKWTGERKDKKEMDDKQKKVDDKQKNFLKIDFGRYPW